MKALQRQIEKQLEMRLKRANLGIAQSAHLTNQLLEQVKYYLGAQLGQQHWHLLWFQTKEKIDDFKRSNT